MKSQSGIMQKQEQVLQSYAQSDLYAIRIDQFVILHYTSAAEDSGSRELGGVWAMGTCARD